MKTIYYFYVGYTCWQKQNLKTNIGCITQLITTPNISINCRTSYSNNLNKLKQAKINY